MLNTEYENSITFPRIIIKCFYNIVLNAPIYQLLYNSYVIGSFKMEQVGSYRVHPVYDVMQLNVTGSFKMEQVGSYRVHPVYDVMQLNVWDLTSL